MFTVAPGATGVAAMGAMASSKELALGASRATESICAADDDGFLTEMDLGIERVFCTPAKISSGGVTTRFDALASPLPGSVDASLGTTPALLDPLVLALPAEALPAVPAVSPPPPLPAAPACCDV